MNNRISRLFVIDKYDAKVKLFSKITAKQSSILLMYVEA